MAKQFKVEIGDRIAYSVQFLKSIGMAHTAMGHARGVVTDVERLGNAPNATELALIDWGRTWDGPNRVNVQNLAKVGANARFAAC